LADIRRLVNEKIEFLVVDKKSDEDITRSILLQVIAEQETDGEPILSQDFPAQMIRAYGSTMQGLVGDYLEQSLRLFSAQQNQIRTEAVNGCAMDPMSATSAMAQENFQAMGPVTRSPVKIVSG
jgi:polyhydroxyalkanoate synthesis repressor PhaR